MLSVGLKLLLLAIQGKLYMECWSYLQPMGADLYCSLVCTLRNCKTVEVNDMKNTEACPFDISEDAPTCISRRTSFIQPATFSGDIF